jgi:hypothetical protein
VLDNTLPIVPSFRIPRENPNSGEFRSGHLGKRDKSWRNRRVTISESKILAGERGGHFVYKNLGGPQFQVLFKGKGTAWAGLRKAMPAMP